MFWKYLLVTVSRFLEDLGDSVIRGVWLGKVVLRDADRGEVNGGNVLGIA